MVTFSLNNYYYIVKGIRCPSRLLFSLDATIVGEQEYEEVKRELVVLSRKMNNAPDEKVTSSAVTCIQDTILEFIRARLSCGIPPKDVKAEMNRLCHTDIAVPTSLWDWTIGQVEEMTQKMIDTPSELKPLAQPKECEEDAPLFSKDVVHHASLCCLAASTCRSEEFNSFFSHKNPQHDLEEASFSLSSNDLKTYLIATNENTMYVAFKSESKLSGWTADYDSFEDGEFNLIYFV